MAGAIHKMAVYLGLVEEDVSYEDGYDSYEEGEDYDPSYAEEDGAEPDLSKGQVPPVAGQSPGRGRYGGTRSPGHQAPARGPHAYHDPASAHVQ